MWVLYLSPCHLAYTALIWSRCATSGARSPQAGLVFNRMPWYKQSIRHWHIDDQGVARGRVAEFTATTQVNETSRQESLESLVDASSWSMLMSQQRPRSASGPSTAQGGDWFTQLDQLRPGGYQSVSGNMTEFDGTAFSHPTDSIDSSNGLLPNLLAPDNDFDLFGDVSTLFGQHPLIGENPLMSLESLFANANAWTEPTSRAGEGES